MRQIIGFIDKSVRQQDGTTALVRHAIVMEPCESFEKLSPEMARILLAGNSRRESKSSKAPPKP